MATHLYDVIKDAQSWNDVYQALTKYNTNATQNSKKKTTAGLLFEEFCQYYYQAEPSKANETKKVYLFNEIPSTTKEKLGLRSKDHGIDLILENHEGEFTAVQCKFTNDQNSNVSWSKHKIANLFAEGERCDFFVVFTNAGNVDRHTLTKKPGQLSIITFNGLSRLSLATLENIKLLAEKKKPKPIKPPKPRDHQKQAIQAVIKSFEKEDRGQLILPCGAGKTLTALWINDALKAKRTIILLPSLALLRQTKKTWDENPMSISKICVCSEADISQTDDGIQDNLYELSGKVSTNPDEIRDWLTKHQKCIVFSTYQSLHAVCDAVKSTEISFDLAICDEAHKTTGSKGKLFSLIHSNDYLPVKKRLYMTATPRVVAGGLKNIKDDDTHYLYDMSNPKDFGQEFYRMSFKEAIDKNILVDYQIIAVGVRDHELAEAIEQRKYVRNHISIEEIASNYALEKIMKQHGSTHALTFHSSVTKAEAFKKRHSEIYPEVKTYHVNGAMTTNERENLLNEFKQDNKAIVTNARCLTEGVDVPAIDLVYFCDPKNSKIDIVQASGRALRKADHKNKKMGYIVVPIFHREKELAEEMIDSGPFKNLLAVIRALSAHDERLVDEITQIKEQVGKRKVKNSRFSFEFSEKVIAFIDFEEVLQEALFDQILSKVKVPWRDFSEAREFARNLNFNGEAAWRNYVKSGSKPHDIPAAPAQTYKNCGWISWGDWLGTNRIATQNRKYKDFHDARKFAHSLKLLSYKEWLNYIKIFDLPNGIPKNPYKTYKDKEWKSWGDWLGTNIIAARYKKQRDFEAARKFVRNQNFKNQAEWRSYCTSGNKPDDIPTNPQSAYKEKGWISMGDWLGTDYIHPSKRKGCDLALM